jgi:hypothetical protein
MDEEADGRGGRPLRGSWMDDDGDHMELRDLYCKCSIARPPLTSIAMESRDLYYLISSIARPPPTLLRDLYLVWYSAPSIE